MRSIFRLPLLTTSVLLALISTALADLPQVSVDVPCDVPSLLSAWSNTQYTESVDAKEYTLNLAAGCVYVLTAPASTGISGFGIDGPSGMPFLLAAVVKVNGNGATIMRAPSAPPFRIMKLGIYSDVTLDSLTISGGRAGQSISDPGNNQGYSGGGIYSLGHLTLSNCTITDNQTGDGRAASLDVPGPGPGGDGGGIYCQSRLNISRSAIFNNHTGNGFAGTNRPGAGGGVYASGSYSFISNTTIANNSTGTGAIDPDRDGTGCCGGGVYGSPTLENVTVVHNTDSVGGAGGVALASGILAYNSIVSDNSPKNCKESFGVSYNNIDSGKTCVTSTFHDSAFSTSPKLSSSLALNGGTTVSYTPLAGSPAIDKGDNAHCADTVVQNRDQRNQARPFGKRCDIGSIEVRATADCKSKPAATKLVSPPNNFGSTQTSYSLTWNTSACATSYEIIVNKSSAKGAKVLDKKLKPNATSVSLRSLKKGTTYSWAVTACDKKGCTKSARRTFRVLKRK